MTKLVAKGRCEAMMSFGPSCGLVPAYTSWNLAVVPATHFSKGVVTAPAPSAGVGEVAFFCCPQTVVPAPSTTAIHNQCINLLPMSVLLQSAHDDEEMLEYRLRAGSLCHTQKWVAQR